MSMLQKDLCGNNICTDAQQCGCANKGLDCDEADKCLVFHMAVAPCVKEYWLHTRRIDTDEGT